MTTAPMSSAIAAGTINIRSSAEISGLFARRLSISAVITIAAGAEYMTYFTLLMKKFKAATPL